MDEIAREEKALRDGGEEVDEFIQNEQYLKRLDAGLATLQCIDYIIGMVCKLCGTKARDRFRQLFKLKDSSMQTVEGILEGTHPLSLHASVPRGIAEWLRARMHVQARVRVRVRVHVPALSCAVADVKLL